MMKVMVNEAARQNRRPGIEKVIAEVRRRSPSLSEQEVLAQAKVLWTSRYLVADGSRGRTSVHQGGATPPRGGSFRREVRGGNSTPALAPVVGPDKSPVSGPVQGV